MSTAVKGLEPVETQQVRVLGGHHEQWDPPGDRDKGSLCRDDRVECHPSQLSSGPTQLEADGTNKRWLWLVGGGGGGGGGQGERFTQEQHGAFGRLPILF